MFVHGVSGHETARARPACVLSGAPGGLGVAGEASGSRPAGKRVRPQKPRRAVKPAAAVAAAAVAAASMAMVNEEHLALCSSPEWARLVEDDLLPWVLNGHDLGDDLLEVGPGPGLTTDILRRLAARVIAVELDAGLADQLAARLAGTNVEVLRADATRLPFPAGRFSAVACLTVLHHIPSAALQDAALAEMGRVLRAGGLLAGSDGLDTPERRRVHRDDIFVPVDPGTLAGRLHAAGFADACVEVRGDRLRFAASAGP
jgi:SAM-dependent methyltransferase